MAAALAVADREGLEAVSTRRLAADLGVTATAMYWHFRSKDDLLGGIAEQLFSQVRLPDDPDASWDERLSGALSAILGVFRPHPAVAELVSHRILASEAGLGITEYVLGVLVEAGFSWDRAAETATQLFVSIIAMVTGHPEPARAVDRGAWEGAVRTRVATLGALDPARFPNVVAAAVPLARYSDEDRYYASGVELLVAGVRGLLLTATA